MKAEFFAVAVLLLLGGVYAVYATHDIRRRHLSEYSMTVSSDGDYEQIRHAGAIRINTDETGIDSISAGGYFSYRRNDRKLKVEPDTSGVLRYTWVENGQERVFDERGKKMLTEAIRELIGYGYDAEGRAARLYQKGGIRALLGEVGQMRTDYVKGIYFDYILRSDSLSQENWISLIGEAAHIGPDHEKSNLLIRIAHKMPADEKIRTAYLEAARTIKPDIEYGKTIRALER